VIGIVIFGEIADAMELTLPLPSELPPLQAISQGNLTANNEWQLREQTRVVEPTLIDCRYTIKSPQGITTFPNPPTPARASVGFCHVFKVFDKADIIGKTLSVSWDGDSGGDPSAIADGAICVLDGVIDRNNATQFPPNNSGVGGCGGLATILHSITQDFVSFPPTTDTISMTLAGSTQDQITIFVMVKDTSATARYALIVKEISILELAKWDWLDPSATVTMATTTTNNDTGVTNTGLTNLLPLILSNESQREHDTFNNAQVIGFTVIGILPVALFFALFSIFSGRIE